MRFRYLTLGSMLLVSSLAACATAPRGSASAEEEHSSAVVERSLDQALLWNCEAERAVRRDLIGVPVAMVVRPDGTVDPGSVRVTAPLRSRSRTAAELRRSEESVRSDAVSRATACSFSIPIHDGQPVHARVERVITVPL